MALKLIPAHRPVKDRTRQRARVGWPLGFNPIMDQHAEFHGITNWSCVCPTGNNFWMRRDGEMLECKFQHHQGYIADLKQFDRTIPERPALAIFRGKTVY